MITSYIIILGISAWLFAFLLIYISKRFGKLFGNPLLISPGFVLLLPLLGFMIVVAAPAPMLVGCILLAGSHFTHAGGYLPSIAHWGVPLIAGLLAGTHFTMPILAHVPPIAFHLAALLALFGYAYSGNYLPSRLAPASMHVLAATLPLIAAPFFGAPSYIAVDVVIIASVLLGANMAAIGTSSVAIARQPFTLLLGWLAIEAASQGAWIPAVLSAAIYVGGLFMAFSRSSEIEPHAP